MLALVTLAHCYILFDKIRFSIRNNALWKAIMVYKAFSEILEGSVARLFTDREGKPLSRTWICFSKKNCLRNSWWNQSNVWQTTTRWQTFTPRQWWQIQGSMFISTIGKLGTSTIIIQAIAGNRKYTIVCPCIASNYANVALCSEDNWLNTGMTGEIVWLTSMECVILSSGLWRTHPTGDILSWIHEIQVSSQSVPILRGSLIPLPSTSLSLIFQSCSFFFPVFDHPVNQLATPHELECRLMLLAIS